MSDDRERVARNLAARGYILDPDPLRPPDPLMPSAEYVSGYDAGFEDAAAIARRGIRRAQRLVVFGLLALVLSFAVLLAAISAPRSGQTTGPVDVSGISSAGQSGAPR